MNDGMSFLGIVALSLIGLLWLAGYLYGLYRLARAVGARRAFIRRPWLAYALSLSVAGMLSTFAWFVPLDPFTRFCLGLVVFVAHAHPLCVGFWMAGETARRENQRVWKERTEEWLSEWERTPKE